MMHVPYTIYDNIHVWLKKNYGKADQCEHPSCNNDSKLYQWAKLKNKSYDFKRDNFWKLCVKCHKKYDIENQLPKIERDICKNFLMIRHDLSIERKEFSKKLNIVFERLKSIDSCEVCPTLPEFISLKKYCDINAYNYDNIIFSKYFHYLEYKNDINEIAS